VSTETLDLRGKVEAALAEASTADPRDAADAVIARLSPAEQAAALRIAMSDYTCAAAERRTAALISPARERPADWPAQLMKARVFTGTDWKFVRDCSLAELDAAALTKHRRAAETHWAPSATR
jgi:hypothetical protein